MRTYNCLLSGFLYPAAVLLTFGLFAPAAHAQIQTDLSGNVYYLGGNNTIDSAHSVSNDANVGLDTISSQMDSLGNPYNPTVNLVNGGSIGYDLNAYNSSIVNVSGGSIGNFLRALDSNTINISGGSIAYYLEVFGNSTVNISGGSIGAQEVFNTGVINIFGTGFTETLVDLNFYGFTEYTLSGALSDGTQYTDETVYFDNYGAGKINLIDTGTGTTTTLTTFGNVVVTGPSVPEPSMVAMLFSLSFSGAGLLFRRRK